MNILPELLCPAGSSDALDAAIEGGADAVYLGGTSFNARINAKNFGGDALRSAVLRAHAFGVKVYFTLNTLATDREMTAYVDAAREAVRAGVDALIVADLGGTMAIRRALPGVELHASTQMSGHNAQMATELSRFGFSRMVVAREISMENLRALMEKSPIEIEMFVHGALCVSHSGQCLFSSIVGGRSGNRGECAQPCRLPYACAGCDKGKKGEQYPLSLKDLSLAAHVPFLIDCGVSSLKVEGRMKSPEYVRDVARIWRRLLDERRAATPREMQELANAFSRGGFTDGYFTEKIGRGMLGIRSESDKSESRALSPFTGLTRRIPLTIEAKICRNEPIALSLSDGIRRVTVEGEVPMDAINAPLSREVVERNLSKLGGTFYEVGSFALSLDDGLMLPMSKLNDLRRRAVQALDEGKTASVMAEEYPYEPQQPDGRRKSLRTARFYDPVQITEQAKSFFDVLYLPLHKHTPIANGVVMPPVIFDGDMQTVEEQLSRAVRNGAQYALVGNLGHLDLVRRVGLIPVGDYRLNITNAQTVRTLEELGVSSMLVSPELTMPQMRDIGGDVAVIVYGKLPLMTLEKCAIRDVAGCERCETGNVTLRDRRGVEFPILREWEHRNVIYNSLPTNMSDREEDLLRAKITNRHFVFTTETPKAVNNVIYAHLTRKPLSESVRRLN